MSKKEIVTVKKLMTFHKTLAKIGVCDMPESSGNNLSPVGNAVPLRGFLDILSLLSYSVRFQGSCYAMRYFHLSPKCSLRYFAFQFVFA